MADKCKTCESDRIAYVSAKCRDLCSVSIKGNNIDDYAPTDMGIGGGDCIEIDYCLNCGQIQDSFPLPETKLEIGSNTDDDEDDY